MSRTYRRKSTKRINWWCSIEHYVTELRRVEGRWRFERFYFEKDSKEYKKGVARYHSDAATTNCKEPGPSFFRNLTAQRPHRRESKRELQKFLSDPDYEVMILSMPKLEYWT